MSLLYLHDSVIQTLFFFKQDGPCENQFFVLAFGDSHILCIQTTGTGNYTPKWNILFLPKHWPTDCSVCLQCQGWECPHHICANTSHQLLLKRIMCGCPQGHSPPTLLSAMLQAHPTTPLHHPLYIPMPHCTRNSLSHRLLTVGILQYYCHPGINPQLLHISGGITGEILTCMTG